MKVLFIGDLYGKPGLDMLYNHLTELKSKYRPNVIVLNAENASYGRGISLKIYK
ncbi:YmdB family metallophosphoesterase, partial [bacterium]|nr:YmdB family metallophosphoesterase [bacterium]